MYFQIGAYSTNKKALHQTVLVYSTDIYVLPEISQGLLHGVCYLILFETVANNSLLIQVRFIVLLNKHGL